MRAYCEFCGNEYTMRHSRHRFCNFYCRQASKRLTKTEKELKEAYRRGHTTMINNALKKLTPSFEDACKEVLARKLRYGGGSCLVAIKTLTQGTFQKLGLNYRGQPPAVFEAAHIISQRLIVEAGGKFFCLRYATGTSKKHRGLARRVYKIESD
jgi:hypothetical protein